MRSHAVGTITIRVTLDDDEYFLVPYDRHYVRVDGFRVTLPTHLGVNAAGYQVSYGDLTMTRRAVHVPWHEVPEAVRERVEQAYRKELKRLSGGMTQEARGL